MFIMRKNVPLMGQPRVELNELAIFTRVVQAGSFSAAARSLGMPKSTVSRKVSELEARVGARLLQRTTRKLGLTDAGRIYFGYSARIVAEAEEADRAIGNLKSAPCGLLRVTAPLSFAMLGPAVAAFLRRHPDVQLELVCTDRRVDLVEEGFDLAVRAGRLDDSSLVVRPLGVLRRVLAAAPGYCRRHGTAKRPEDLERHTGLVFGGGTARGAWSLQSGERKVEVRINARMTVNDFEVLGDAVRAGLGIASMPALFIEEDLRKGRLVRVVPGWRAEDVPLQALYPTSRHLSPRVAAFVAVLLEELTPRLRAADGA